MIKFYHLAGAVVFALGYAFVAQSMWLAITDVSLTISSACGAC